jgi:hypothetical protein
MGVEAHAVGEDQARCGDAAGLRLARKLASALALSRSSHSTPPGTLLSRRIQISNTAGAIL